MVAAGSFPHPFSPSGGSRVRGEICTEVTASSPRRKFSGQEGRSSAPSSDLVVLWLDLAGPVVVGPLRPHQGGHWSSLAAAALAYGAVGRGG